MVTKRTGQPAGRPKWDLLADRDRYLVAAFSATQIVENKVWHNSKATRHAVAMTYAAIECGKMVGSSENLAIITRGEGKLNFQTTISWHQYKENPKHNSIKARADDILRKAERAMKSNRHEWIEAMSVAIGLAYYYPEREDALTLTRLHCLVAYEMAFFERSLKPFIVGRFDSSKRVIFSLPDFMPNFVSSKWP
jgi:hypothetical protein